MEFEDAIVPLNTRGRAPEHNPYLDVVASLPVNPSSGKEGAKSFTIPGILDSIEHKKALRQLGKAGEAADVTVAKYSEADLSAAGPAVRVTFWAKTRVAHKPRD